LSIGKIGKRVGGSKGGIGGIGAGRTGVELKCS
jgi:hypothetical protein